MDIEPVTGPLDCDQPQGICRLVSASYAYDDVVALAPACHRDVPGVDGVVLTIVAVHAGRIILSDSGPNGDQLEDLHAALGQGPCIDAPSTGTPVAAVDLDHPRARERWPRFAPQALACGIRAVFAFPALLDAQPVGVLSVYRATAGPLSVVDHDQVARYAHAAAILLLGTAHIDDTGTVSMPLPNKAAEVQQAVGVVMEYARVDAVTALHRLRVYANHSARPIRDVATEVLTGRLPFDPTRLET